MLERLKSIYKDYRFTGIIDKIAYKALGLFGIKIYVYTIYKLNLKESDPECSLPVRFKELNYNDFLTQKEICPEWFTESKLNDLYEAFQVDGNKAFGYFENDILACYGWISLKYIMPNKLTLLQDDGYLWDDFTHPDFRGRGLHATLSKFRCAELSKLGKKRALIIIRRYNHASISGIVKIGFTPLVNFVNYRFRKRSIKSTFKYNNQRLCIIEK